MLMHSKNGMNFYRKIAMIKQNEVRYETFETEDADYIVTAYGTAARIAMNAINRARKDGLKIGMIRPVTLWPFPEQPFIETRHRVKGYLSVEMSAGRWLRMSDLLSRAMPRFPSLGALAASFLRRKKFMIKS